jgi:hypothetical protein
MVCPSCRTPYWKTRSKKNPTEKAVKEPKLRTDMSVANMYFADVKPVNLQEALDSLIRENPNRRCNIVTPDNVSISTPQHIPQKDITPDNQDEIQKECFLCAKDLKFDCQARKDLLPVKDICNACLGQAFWGSSDMYRDAYDMEPEIVFDNPGATDDVSRLKAIAYGCKFKIKYPNMIICPNKDRGKIVNEACTYCWELEEIFGTAAAGYLERRMGKIIREQTEDKQIANDPLQTRMNKNVKNEKNTDNTAPTFVPKSEQPKLCFNYTSKKWQNISDKDVEIWQDAYPACDLEIELTRMIAWIVSNPTKGKKSNWRKFINNWLSRTQDKGGTKNGVAETYPPQRYDRVYRKV